MSCSLFHTSRLLAVLLLLPFLGTGCELLGGREDEAVVPTGVFVANQGNFGDGNGTVTVYDLAAGTVSTAAISGLGSILQSLHLTDDRLYLLANTGGRIDVFDAATLGPVGQVTGLVSPRYMAVDGGTAYVTNLYGSTETFTGGTVSVVDLGTYTRIKDIAVGDNPEGVAVAASRVYVANHGFGTGHTVSVLDAATGAVVATIDVGCDGPRTLVADAEEEVYVFCTGRTLYDENWNVTGATDGAVVVLDGRTGAVAERFDLEGRILTAGPGQDAYYAPAVQEIYAVQDADTILRFDTVTNSLAGAVGPLAGAPIGAVAYDAGAGRLYVAHVPGFTESGTVTIHDRDGAQVGSFAAGIAPGHIAIRTE